MQPLLNLLSEELTQRVLDEAFQLMIEPGIKVQSPLARKLLADAGTQVNEAHEIVQISEKMAREALSSVPRDFYLYNRSGEKIVHYGGDSVHFDPGSCGVHILDPDTLEHQPSISQDLIRVIKITEVLPQYDAQSTAILCNEIPKEIGDLYRLYLVLLFSSKPVVTGAFATKTTQVMFDMLSIVAGSKEASVAKPLAIFDVCPSPPLLWSEFGANNLIDLARAGIPAQIVSMPLAGAAAPVTLLGSIVQHAAECLSGITIHQLAKPGSPIVWGGATAIFDMRQGTTPMGAIETAMMDVAYAQVGKSLGLPTHTYLGASDAKIVDAQAGLESGTGILMGALAGINMISGAGMLDFLACQSPEKLVIDAEAISMARRLLKGFQVQTKTLAIDMFEGIDFKSDFLKQKVTRQLYKKEQYLPSYIIDRSSNRAWQQGGRLDTFTRARNRVSELIAEYERPRLPREQEHELQEMIVRLAKDAGMDDLPVIDGL